MKLLLQSGGGIVVAVTLFDMFFTVLSPASGHGPIQHVLTRVVWLLFRFFGGLMTGRRRRDFLSYTGPVLFAASFITWFVLLVIGWAMIFEPAVGTAITASSGSVSPRWVTAIYYSGFNLTTLGVGNIVANDGLYRLLTIAEAALGFASSGMVITYFLSVYPELLRRNAFAQGLHNLTGRTGDAVELLTRLTAGTDSGMARQHLQSQADFLRQIYQTHRFFPVLRHFRYREAFYELPQILMIVLDTTSLIQSTLDEEHYANLFWMLEVEDVFNAAMSLIDQLLSSAFAAAACPIEAEGWSGHYQAAIARLAQNRVPVRSDVAAGAKTYIDLRARWDPALRTLARSMLYQPRESGIG